MKFANIIVGSVLLLTLAGCANSSKSLNDAYKNKTSRAILEDGNNALVKHNYAEAVANFEALDALYPFSKEVEQAQLNGIYAYYKNEKYVEALAAIDRYIHLYPRGEHTPYAYYMRGIINFESTGTGWLQKIYRGKAATLDMKSLEYAFNDFNDLIQKFPESIYNKDARKKMVYIRNLLAEHEVSVAHFYLKKKAYVAAANRANYVVTHLGETVYVEDALKVMVEAYKKLGAEKSANTALKVLKLNYPNSL